MSENFEYVNQYYGVNACIGRRVVAYGCAGTITKDFGQYIGIVLDTAPHSEPERYHPTDGIEYGDVIEYTPPKMTSRQAAAKRKYGDYLDADYGHGFGEWLGIQLPEYEYRETTRYKYEYRMVRHSRAYWDSYYDICGEWRPTKKAAKASYKEALKKHREGLRNEQ